MLLPEPIIAPRFASLAPKRIRLTPLALAIHLALGAATFVGSSGQALAQSAAAAIQYDIPAGPLAEALNRFALQSGVAIVVDASKVQGLRAAGLNGSYGVEEGFGILLRGSGYAIGRTAAGYVLVAAPVQQGAQQRSTAEAVLPVVTVTASTEALPGELPKPFAGGQVARGGRVGLLGNRDVLDTPFSTMSYTSQLMKDQQAKTLIEVTANDPSVRSHYSQGMYDDRPAIRGFFVAPQNMTFNGMYGVNSAFSHPLIGVERVEILKGPTAMLSGMAIGSSVGGTINYVPKRATASPITQLTTSFASASQPGASVDIGRRFGTSGELGVRVNAGYQNGDTEVDLTSDRLGSAAVGLDWQGESTTVELDIGSVSRRIDGMMGGLSLVPGLVLPSAPSNKTQLGQPWALYKSDETYGLLGVTHYLTQDLSIFGKLGGRDSDGAFNGFFPTIVNSQGDTTAAPFLGKNYSKTLSGEAGLRGKITTGSIKHEITLVANRLTVEAGSAFVDAATQASNIYRPVFSSIPGTPPSSAAKTSETTLTSVGIMDVMSVLDGRLQALVGVRQQSVEVDSFNAAGTVTTRYDERAVTPTLAVLGKLRPDLSIYASYSKGLTTGPTAPTGTVNVGEVFAPLESSQREIGLKWERGTILATLAWFDITQPSGITNPVTNRFGIDGKQRNRGVELVLAGELTKSFRLLGGATYIDAQLVKTAGGTNDGRAAPGVPERYLNLGVEWDPQALQGWTFSTRATKTSSSYVNVANTSSIPGWTRWDAGVKYATKIGGRPTTFRAAIDNLLDKSFWMASPGGGFNPVAPRTYRLSASIDF